MSDAHHHHEGGDRREQVPEPPPSPPHEAAINDSAEATGGGEGVSRQSPSRAAEYTTKSNEHGSPAAAALHDDARPATATTVAATSPTGQHEGQTPDEPTGEKKKKKGATATLRVVYDDHIEPFVTGGASQASAAVPGTGTRCLETFCSALSAALSPQCDVVPIAASQLTSSAARTRDVKSVPSPTAVGSRSELLGAVVILTSACQPRSLGTLNAALDGGLYSTRVPHAVVAVHVPLLQCAAVAEAHKVADVPQLTWSSFARYASAKERSFAKLGFDRPIVPFALSLLPSLTTATTGTGHAVSGTNLSKADRDSIDDLSRWLRYSIERSAQGETPPPPPAANLRRSVWSRLESVGRARFHTADDDGVPEFVALATRSSNCGAGFLFLSRRTGEPQRRVPASVVERSLLSGSNLDTGDSHDDGQSLALADVYTRVAAGTRGMGRAYLLKKAVDIQSSEVDRHRLEANQCALSAAPLPQGKDARPNHVVRTEDSRDEKSYSKRQRQADALSAECATLKRTSAKLKRDASRRRDEILDLERQLEEFAKTEREQDSVHETTGETSDTAASDPELETAKAQLATLEAEVARCRKETADAEHFASNRAEVTSVYVQAWKVNQATRATVRRIQQQVDHLNKQHADTQATQVARLDNHIAGLDARIATIEAQAQHLWEQAVPRMATRINGARLDIDFGSALSRGKRDGGDSARGVCSRVYERELGGSVARTTSCIGKLCHAREALLEALAELAGVLSRRQAALGRIAAACEQDALLAAAVVREDDACGYAADADIARLVDVDATAAAIMDREVFARQMIADEASLAWCDSILRRAGTTSDRAAEAVRAITHKADVL